MKEVLKKIRNKRLKGNVSLLVIFILLASSVISLLSINQIQRLLTYWNTTFNYFRAFYLAKAGTELGLTEVYYREAWFEDSISSWNAIVTENLVGAYSGFNPYFTMSISWNFQYLTDDVRYTNECSGGNKITLGSWEWIVLSLFIDKTKDDKIFSGPSEIEELDKSIIEKLKLDGEEKNWNFKHYIFWLFDYDNNLDMWNIIVKTWTNLDTILTYDNINNLKTRRYLSIKNPWNWNDVVSFCITTSNTSKWTLIPYSNALITVRGNYGDMEVWLQSVVKRTSPGWSLNVLWW